jgi:hypothetical protein
LFYPGTLEEANEKGVLSSPVDTATFPTYNFHQNPNKPMEDSFQIEGFSFILDQSDPFIKQVG